MTTGEEHLLRKSARHGNSGKQKREASCMAQRCVRVEDDWWIERGRCTGFVGFCQDKIQGHSSTLAEQQPVGR